MAKPGADVDSSVAVEKVEGGAHKLVHVKRGRSQPRTSFTQNSIRWKKSCTKDRLAGKDNTRLKRLRRQDMVSDGKLAERIVKTVGEKKGTVEERLSELAVAEKEYLKSIE